MSTLLFGLVIDHSLCWNSFSLLLLHSFLCMEERIVLKSKRKANG